MARAVKMGSTKAVPEQDYVSRKQRDNNKQQRAASRKHKVSQRETLEDS